MARERRDPQRVVRSSAAPRSVGVQKKWDAGKESANAARRSRIRQGSGTDVEGEEEEDEELVNTKDKVVMCLNPEEARSDLRYVKGDTVCPVCGGGLPPVFSFEDSASRLRAQRLRGMDGVVQWNVGEKGHVWQHTGKHVAHGRGTAAQRLEQVQVPHSETNVQVSPHARTRWILRRGQCRRCLLAPACAMHRECR